LPDFAPAGFSGDRDRPAEELPLTTLLKGAIAPGPEGHRLLGSLPAVRRDPIALFLSSARTYGDIVRLRFASKTGHLLRHPDYVKHVLQDNFRNFGKQTRGFQALRETLGQGLLTSEGDFWLRQRRTAQPAFHHQQIAGFAETMGRATADLLDRWDQETDLTAPIDVAETMMGLTLRIVGLTLLSRDVSGNAAEIGRALDTILHTTMATITRIVDVPRQLPTRRNRQFQEARSTLDRIILQIIGDRRTATERPADLLTMLMAAKDPETGEGMSDTQLRDEVMTIFLAGHETTANALTWTWYLLSKHPVVARTMEDEVDRVLAGRPPTLADLPKLTYTRQVLEESMRLYPPAWMIARSVIAEDEIGGYRIPPDSIVFLSPYVTHRHPEFWPNPEGFDPERFAPGQAANRPKFAYFPFGGGPRLCIGREFALMEAQLILAQIAQRYRLHLLPGHVVDPEPVITLRPRHGMLMTRHRRL
jgi:cytochrome P450